ncbi:purine nucleosidase/pyrimidine-specific ribonucleoside hydrolase [Tamaricihabitans halophyticus]|uniref:Purine nucleosidase/pyrimidine-specific ribonucleoside hydrolase n=1 Tax=Tamaricihabitans halophyticus TaxID=1262583 RepID=A0A4R2QJ10_9PSEU|nr:nucleoside hydrolase [Tamaricihabitans halophyticus]TCP49360.1 purine nucleosidase/pyrimidine-specific ribonucleoside hydrolase [Tamaricihabitans halophyticus]
MPTRPVLLDCDPGHDDALAIILAAAHPALDLRAISTVAGNQTLPKTTLNARRICTVAGIEDVPIVSGRAAPLRGPALVAEDVHGESGLDGPAFGPPQVPLTSTDGIGYLRDMLRASQAPMTVVATGPLTNIAALLLSAPDVVERIEEIVFMGGSTAEGNTTPYAEFNMIADPEAADIVVHSGVPVTMCGLNVTHQALADDRVCAEIAALNSPLAGICVELLGFFASTYRQLWGFPAPPVHDPVAVARVAEPELVSCELSRVDIELTGSYTRGATVVDRFARTGREPNARVATHLDHERFFAALLDAIRELSTRDPNREDPR